jgi:hypothetical protein
MSSGLKGSPLLTASAGGDKAFLPENAKELHII